MPLGRRELFTAITAASAPAGAFVLTTSASTAPGGTYNNFTGKTSESDCVDVVLNEWAPTGSAEPELCFSGFTCPGRAEDDIYNGSKPIIVAEGATTETVEEVETTVLTKQARDRCASPTALSP